MKKIFLVIHLIFVTLLFAQNSVKTDSLAKKVVLTEDASAKKYVRECSSCHTIGGGKLKGPDLLQAITWKNEDLSKAIKKMEKEVGVMSDQTISEMIALLKDANVKTRIAAEEQRQLQARRASLAPPDTNIGKNLFWGTQKFTNGGLACFACHKVNGVGGTLGIDLTQAYTKLGEVALISACEKTSYKIMAPHYQTKPVTPQEAVHLTAFFKHVSQAPMQSEFSFYTLSTILAFGLLVGIVFIYKSAGRKNSTIRKK